MHINNNNCLTHEPLVADLLFWMPPWKKIEDVLVFRGHTEKPHISQTHHHPLPFDFVASWTSEHCWIFCFPRSDRSAPPWAIPRAVRAVRLDKDSVKRPCHSGMSDFEALMASYLMTDSLTYPQVSPPTPNNRFAVEAAHTCPDMQVRRPIPAQDGSVQSGKLQCDQEKA